MGAFIAYLYRAEGVGHFFVLAPNLPIYNKVLTDFTPNMPKYVFQGISEFANNPPEIITGDNYQTGRGIRSKYRAEPLLLDDDPIQVNIFNISKINTEVRGGKAQRIKRLSEYIGDNYFDYLAKLDDLVLLMDESHRYRASAGGRAINELKPILGLELTATPQIERGRQSEPLKNVIFSYPLSAALTDGFVKQPAVATRQNFNVDNYDEDFLEKIKLEDGVRVHEECKVQLEVYSRENHLKRVKPFVLVVARDADHANALVKTIEAADFFNGQHKGKVITVHSKIKGEEGDEIVQQLPTVEDPHNPVEIVVHVNMLNEGWDVTNLYSIVPLRKADSRTPVEQSIGRGLRLPYGRRTGNDAVDRLTIVAHDKIQEIVDAANRGDSILVTGIVIGKDIPEKKSTIIQVEPTVVGRIIGQTGSAAGGQEQKPLLETEQEKDIALTTLEVFKEFERLSRSSDLTSPEVQRKIVEKVHAVITPAQRKLVGIAQPPPDVPAVVEKTTNTYVKLSIDVPRVVVVPTGEVTCGVQDFALDTSGIHLQPVPHDILIQMLRDNQR